MSELVSQSVRNLSKCCKTQVFCTFWVESVLRATAACHFSTSDRQKVARARQFFSILTYKCASRHSGVRLLQIETCKMAPTMRCFVHFDLQMCFAPQRRATFADRDLQNGSDNEVFCTFWLTNVLRATAACHFSGSQLPKWLREWGVLYILTHKCASRHSGVQFFIPPLSSYLRTRRFYEATFRTAGTTNHWKNTAIRDVANISRTCILSPDCCVVHCFSTRLDCCCTLLFYTTLQLSILSEVSTLNFLRLCIYIYCVLHIIYHLSSIVCRMYTILYYIYYSTSYFDTTGGGGSFKNRKRIGEISCCESQMSAQNTDQLTN